MGRNDAVEYRFTEEGVHPFCSIVLACKPLFRMLLPEFWTNNLFLSLVADQEHSHLLHTLMQVHIRDLNVYEVSLWAQVTVRPHPLYLFQSIAPVWFNLGQPSQSRSGTKLLW